ncbi:hypothetical protein ACA910_004404 [Epithemia clementina (nom. ined.)]
MGVFNQRRMPSRQERVPETLQTVFLSSNRGKTVDTPPPQQVASKTFFKNWFFQRQTSAPIVPRKQKQLRSFFFYNTENSHNNKGSQNPLQREKSLRRASNATTLLESSPPASPQTSPQTSPRPAKESLKSLMAAAHAHQSTSTPKHIPIVPVQMSPQGYLDSLLRSRGYSCQKYRVLETAYYNKPTPLQMSSYHVKLVEIMRSGDGKKLREIIMCGLSRNPCNQHGESLVHAICRRGDYKLLQVMIDAGATVQVSDDHGRTPLHDACWSSAASFAAVDIVLQQDTRLVHMMDARGATPLMYVRNEHWSSWQKFLRSRVELYWPVRNVEQDGEQGPPPLTEDKPNCRLLPDPEDALPIEMAAMVASGRITPQEAAILRAEAEEDSDEDSSFYSDSEFSDSEFDSEDDEVMEDEDDDCEDGDEDTEGDDEDDDSEQQDECPGSAGLSDESTHSPKNFDTNDSGESANADSDSDSDDDAFFDEQEIADLIRGITTPGSQKCAWTSSNH